LISADPASKACIGKRGCALARTTKASGFLSISANCQKQLSITKAFRKAMEDDIRGTETLLLEELAKKL
jgi:hypothetical protein